MRDRVVAGSNFHSYFSLLILFLPLTLRLSSARSSACLFRSVHDCFVVLFSCSRSRSLPQHKKAFDDIKDYYRDVKQGNLEHIRSLKEKVQKLRDTDQGFQAGLFALRFALTWRDFACVCVPLTCYACPVRNYEPSFFCPLHGCAFFVTLASDAHFGFCFVSFRFASRARAEVDKKQRINKRLSKPLEMNEKKLQEMREQLATYEKEQGELEAVKAQLEGLEQRYKNKSWELEVAQQKYEQLERSRAALREKLEKTVYNVQQKAGFRNLMLERKISATSQDAEKIEAALSEVRSLPGERRRQGVFKRSFPWCFIALPFIVVSAPHSRVRAPGACLDEPRAEHDQRHPAQPGGHPHVQEQDRPEARGRTHRAQAAIRGHNQALRSKTPRVLHPRAGPRFLPQPHALIKKKKRMKWGKE